MLRHGGRGFDGREIVDFHERVPGIDRLADRDIDLGNDSGERGIQSNHGWGIARLAALDPYEFVALVAFHIRQGNDGLGAATDATAHDALFAWQHLNATEGKYRFLKIGFFSLDSFDAEVIDAHLIKDDGGIGFDILGPGRSQSDQRA